MVWHAFSIDLSEEISGWYTGREPRLVKMEEERDSKLGDVYVIHRLRASSSVFLFCHLSLFFSLQRYFFLDKGILKYGKSIADVSRSSTSCGVRGWARHSGNKRHLECVVLMTRLHLRHLLAGSIISWSEIISHNAPSLTTIIIQQTVRDAAVEDTNMANKTQLGLESNPQPSRWEAAALTTAVPLKKLNNNNPQHQHSWWDQVEHVIGVLFPAPVCFGVYAAHNCSYRNLHFCCVPRFLTPCACLSDWEREATRQHRRGSLCHGY